MEYSIRKMKRSELGQVQELTEDANWNYTLNAIEEYYSLNQDHSYCAVTADGKVLSHCLWLPLGGMPSNQVAMVGLFMTRKMYRRKGIGERVLKTCVASIGDMKMGLHAAMEMQPLYESLGFKHTGLQVKRYWCTISSEKREAMRGPLPAGHEILNIDDVSKEALIKYDTDYIHPVPRDAVLNLLIKNHHAFFVGVEGGIIVGYGCVKKMHKAYTFKALYAKNEDIARALFNVLLDSIPVEDTIDLQVLSENPDAQKLFEKYGMVQRPFRAIQMFTKEVITPQNVAFVYGVMDYVLTIV